MTFGELPPEVERVLAAVQRCLSGLAGNAGDLGRYTILDDTFEVVDTRQLEGGRTEHVFRASALLESEHDGPIGPEHPPPLPLEGSIVLDASGRVCALDVGHLTLANVIERG
jgi:hypothetical protein